MDRVVFLDIDGVLQPTNSRRRFDHKDDFDALKQLLAETYHDQGFLDADGYDVGAVYYDWDPQSVANLRQVLARNDARIVLSSDWRFGHPHDEMARFFELHGLAEFYAEDLPSTGRYSRKEDDIPRYVDAHPELTHYAVVDDKDMYGTFGDHFVSTRAKDRIGIMEAQRIGYLLRHGPWWRGGDPADGGAVRDGIGSAVVVDAADLQEATDVVSGWSEVFYEAHAKVVLAGPAAEEYLSMPRKRGLEWRVRSLFGKGTETARAPVDGCIPGCWDADDPSFLPSQVARWAMVRPSLGRFVIASGHEPDEWGRRLSDVAIPLGRCSDSWVTRKLLFRT